MSSDTSTASPSALPPRKRAKTQEEKEQRRIERILRNRRAAHASREKKRRHVELLETHVMDMDNLINAYKRREAQLKEMLESLSADQSQLDSLEAIPQLKMDTADLLETNRRSNKKVKATPKPRPIVLKRSSRDETNSEDEDEEDEEAEEEEDFEDDQLMLDSSVPEIIIKREDGEEEIYNQKQKRSLARLSASSETSQSAAPVYLSPPISSLDSTSPSNLTMEMDSKLDEEYYISHPLFDDLDKTSDDFFSTNLQIKHEDDDEDFHYPPLSQALFEQQFQQPQMTKLEDLNEKNSGFKLMHHPAVMMVMDVLFVNREDSIGLENGMTEFTKTESWPETAQGSYYLAMLTTRRRRGKTRHRNSPLPNDNSVQLICFNSLGVLKFHVPSCFPPLRLEKSSLASMLILVNGLLGQTVF